MDERGIIQLLTNTRMKSAALTTSQAGAVSAYLCQTTASHEGAAFLTLSGSSRPAENDDDEITKMELIKP